MNKRVYQLVSVIVAVALTLGSYLSVQALANTYYVSVNGNDSNACTNIAPCKTFNRALTLAQTGDVVHILPGTYTQQLIVTKSDLTIVGEGATIDALGLWSGVTLSGKNLTLLNVVVKNSTSHGIFISGQNIRVAGSEIYNSVLECVTSASQCGSALKISTGADGIVLENNYVHDNKSEGIATTMGKNVQVRNNLVSNNFSVEIYTDNSPNVRVENNHIFCNKPGSTAIAFDEEIYSGWGQQLSNLYIGRNTISGCDGGLGYWGSQRGIKTALIEYNTFYDIKNSTMYFASGNNSNVVIAHNIFSNIKPWFDSTTGITIDNNFWISTKPWSGTGTLGPNDKAGSPLFAVAPVWNDPNTFNQLSASPACGYGRWDCGGGSSATVTPTASVIASFTPTQTSTILATLTKTLTPTSTLMPPTPILPSNTPNLATLTPTATFTLVPSPTSVPPTATSTTVPLQPQTTQPASEVIYDDTSSAFVYSSGWKDVSDQQAYNSSYKVTSVRNASVTLSFTGQSFSIHYTSGSSYRNMDVYVDGVLVGTIDQKTSLIQYQQSWDYPGQLTPGTHILKLVTRNKNNAYDSLDQVIVR